MTPHLRVRWSGQLEDVRYFWKTASPRSILTPPLPQKKGIKLSGVATKCLTFCKKTCFFFCGGGGPKPQPARGKLPRAAPSKPATYYATRKKALPANDDWTVPIEEGRIYTVGIDWARF